jgi:hypothetical protein
MSRFVRLTIGTVGVILAIEFTHPWLNDGMPLWTNAVSYTVIWLAIMLYCDLQKKESHERIR